MGSDWGVGVDIPDAVTFGVIEISGVVVTEVGITVAGVRVTGTVAYTVCGAGVGAAVAVGCKLVHPDIITTVTMRAQQGKIPRKIAFLLMTEPPIL